MNFQDIIKAGKYAARPGNPHWDERTYIYLDGDIIIYSSRGYDYTWTPSHPDLLADDWIEVIPTP